MKGHTNIHGQLSANSFYYVNREMCSGAQCIVLFSITKFKLLTIAVSFLCVVWFLFSKELMCESVPVLCFCTVLVLLQLIIHS